MTHTATPLPADLAAFLRDELGDIGDAAPASLTAEGPVWVWNGAGKDGQPAKGRWYFLTIEGDAAIAVKAASAGRSNGWGSVKVEAVIGATTWSTSIFRAQNMGGFILPIKASVRKAEKIDEGTQISVTLQLV